MAARGYKFYLRVLQVSYWLIVLVIMTTPICSHVKDKSDMFTARGEDMIF